MSRPRKYKQYGFCVYRCWDKEVLLYVGMTDNLSKRMRAHSASKSPWLPQMTRITWDDCTDRNEALKAEGQAIATENPLFNKRNQGWQGIADAQAVARIIELRWQADQPKLAALLIEHPKIQDKLATYQTDH